MGVLNTEGAAMAADEEETAARGTGVGKLPPPGGTLDHVRLNLLGTCDPPKADKAVAKDWDGDLPRPAHERAGVV